MPELPAVIYFQTAQRYHPTFLQANGATVNTETHV